MLLPLVLIILNMADVIAICVWQMFMPLGLMLLPIYVLFVIWLVLLPLIVADVVAT